MNWTMWFMAAQLVLCVAGTLGFGFLLKNPAMALVWFGYALAQIGWVLLAYGEGFGSPWSN